MNEKTKERIRLRIREKMDRIIERKIVALPVHMEKLRETNPFGSRLVPDEIWKSSTFERSFVTSFGQGVYEQVAFEIATGSGAEAQNQHQETVIINQFQHTRIDELIEDQRRNRTKGSPIWEEEVSEIKSLGTRQSIEVPTLFDLYIKRPDHSEEYYSLKTVKPNLDQAQIAKRDMLCIEAAKENGHAYFALPFNPDGEGNQYSWSVPSKLFDMQSASCVLIGAKFWNMVGQNENTYRKLLEVFEQLGTEYVKKIRNEYLGL
ncbi:TdeIII family type II restriction endonuclease [Bacillaceae bacterium Marseille-Q3522]|nr:TdeIII family type II restriction endonuclease [Bacillaceae bacterium Marseille-Q3522]